MSSARRRAVEAADRDRRRDLLDVLARHAATGDEHAAADLAWAILRFRLARPAIRRYLLGEADIEAAEQCTLVAVALRIGSFRGDATFTTWLHRVATNEARQLVRAEARHADRREFGDVDVHAERFVATVSSMIADRAAVESAMAELSPDHRVALVLREEEGLTYDEIAARRGIPVNTAKSHVRRGRAALAQALIGVITEDRSP